jgi:hypothetical protein
MATTDTETLMAFAHKACVRLARAARRVQAGGDHLQPAQAGEPHHRLLRQVGHIECARVVLLAMCEIAQSVNGPLLCSDVDAEHLREFKFYFGAQGYAITRLKSKSTPITLHKYVFTYLIGKTVPDGHVIDHINRNKLDNRRENLRILTYSQNAQNRTQSTPGYHGIAFSPSGSKWVAQFGQLSISRRDSDEEAARDYDQYVIKFVNRDGHLNFEYTDQEKTDIQNSDFQPMVSRITAKRILLPSNVHSKTRADGVVEYCVAFHNKHLLYTLNKEEAIAKAIQVRADFESEKEQEHAAKVITRNDDGLAVIKLGGKSSKSALVDDALWHELSRHSWSESNVGYPSSRFDGHLWTMHKYLFRTVTRDPSQKLVIDHIDRNKMNNMMANLRLTDYKTNAKNSTYTSTMQKVDQFDKQGNFIKTWDDIRQVRDELGFYGVQGIVECCTGKANSCKGFQWKYHVDEREIAHVARSVKGVKIDQFTIAGVFVKTFDNMTQAAEACGSSSSAITACAKGRQKTCGGFVWRYQHIKLAQV